MRLRQDDGVRAILGAEPPKPTKFIWPVFVVEGVNVVQEIPSMPNQFRYSIDRLIPAVEEVVNQGVGGIMIFANIDSCHKSEDAAYSFNDSGLAQKAIIAVKQAFPDLVVFADVCMCSYTTHGHCGILNNDGKIDLNASLEVLSNIALSYAQCGAHVAPSAMMDSQIKAIRTKLDTNGFDETILMSYSTKFASAMYGPFRDAADSAPSFGDRRSYQAMYSDLDRALLESVLDEEEGADILMVKPALFYLDIVSKIKDNTMLPVSVYNVSGEYSMLIATAQNSWGELYPMVRESLAAFERAGADIIISYWANQLSKIYS
jgi:porphobilinogen synthase